MLEPMPLPREIFDRALKFGVSRIEISFQGGSDEANLNINVERDSNQPHKNFDSFESDIEEWVWEVYQYSGAGEGVDYGDDITYNIKDRTVAVSEWYHERIHNDGDVEMLELKEVEKPKKDVLEIAKGKKTKRKN